MAVPYVYIYVTTFSVCIHNYLAKNSFHFINHQLLLYKYYALRKLCMVIMCMQLLLSMHAGTARYLLVHLFLRLMDIAVPLENKSHMYTYVA